MITAKSPQGNRDILQASANNFYHGVSLADLKGFKEKYPLNSRLVKTRTANWWRRSIAPARPTAKSRRAATRSS